MTGITGVSRESVFSDLNHLEVVTVTSDKYETVFGFTEEEVSGALEEYGLADRKEEVKNGMTGLFLGIAEISITPGPLRIFLIKETFLRTGPIPVPTALSAD